MGERAGQVQVRKSIRIPGYDYALPGGYFVTICARNRKRLFGEIADGKACLNQVGKIIEKCWLAIPSHFPHAEIDAFVVMPDHTHGIVILHEGVPRRGTACRAPTEDTEAFGKPVAGSIPTIIRSFKAAVTREVGRAFPGLNQPIWQRNYYEHIIRDEDELNLVRQYVFTNPAPAEPFHFPKFQLDRTTNP